MVATSNNYFGLVGGHIYEARLDTTILFLHGTAAAAFLSTRHSADVLRGVWYIVPSASLLESGGLVTEHSCIGPRLGTWELSLHELKSDEGAPFLFISCGLFFCHFPHHQSWSTLASNSMNSGGSNNRGGSVSSRTLAGYHVRCMYVGQNS